MPRVALYNVKGETVGDIDLPDKVFNVEVNPSLLHQAIVCYLANQRQGTASTRTRGEVSGGGRKPWRQKGTGRARQGSIRAPHWPGGGVVFGPKPRDYRQEMPKQARRLALRGALSEKVRQGRIRVVDQLQLDEPHTRDIAQMLRSFELTGQKALIVTADTDRNVYKSARNIPGVAAFSAPELNVYQVLNHSNLIITKDAVERVQEVLGR